MSGPIVRKYGFPNHDKIFGERPIQHGLEDAEEPGDKKPAKAAAGKPKKEASAKPKGAKPKK